MTDTSFSLNNTQDLSLIVQQGVQKHDRSDVLSILYDAVESTVGGVIITDMSGSIVYANLSFIRLFGYDSLDEVLGMKGEELFASQEIHDFSDLNTIIDAVKGHTQDFIAINKQERRFFVEVSASNVFNDDGVVIGRMASFVDISERKALEQEKDMLVGKLQQALEKVKLLNGLLPICASCKKIRDEEGYWKQIESYIQEHSDATFSHGLCDECGDKLYGDKEWYQRVKQRREENNKAKKPTL